jgi:hypothetical protein
MNSHELAKKLLELPNMPVRLFTDHGQVSCECLHVDEHIYSEKADGSFQKSDTDGYEGYDDAIAVIEIYGG